LRRQAQNLVPCACSALGAQKHAQRGDVLGPGAVKVAQGVARRDEIPFIQG
jgi:hypothetical protein